jgi:hypothetical protein
MAAVPSATPLPLEGRYSHSSWSVRLAEGRWPDKRLATTIGSLLDELAARKDYFHQIRMEGGKVEFFVGWFFDGMCGAVLDCC